MAASRFAGTNACLLVLLAACAQGSKSPVGGTGGGAVSGDTTGGGGTQAGTAGPTGGAGGVSGVPSGGASGGGAATGGVGGATGGDAQVPDASAADAANGSADAATSDAAAGTDAGGGGTGAVFDAGFDDFTGWMESGSGWGTNDAPGSYPASGSGDPVAHSDNCNSAGCWIETTEAIDLSGYSSATLHLLRYSDSGVDNDEYLAVQVFHQGAWLEVVQWLGGDDTWHAESIDLTTVPGFDISLATDFRIRIEAQTNLGTEDIYVDDVRVTAVP